MTKAAFAPVMAQLSAQVSATPALANFARWNPGRWLEPTPQIFPAVHEITSWIKRDAPDWACLARAAPHIEWRQSYTVDEVGTDFMANYAHCEVLGRDGHHHSDDMRAFIAWWGAELNYPPHDHEAEEIYCILAGHAEFSADGLPTARLGPGDTRLHTPCQRHAMITTDSPVLTFVLWRGPGLDGTPKISNP